MLRATPEAWHGLPHLNRAHPNAASASQPGNQTVPCVPCYNGESTNSYLLAVSQYFFPHYGIFHVAPQYFFPR